MYLFKYLLSPHANSVYIDCRAYDGDTVSAFHEAAINGYEKIIAFEPDQAIYKNYYIQFRTIVSQRFNLLTKAHMIIVENSALYQVMYILLLLIQINLPPPLPKGYYK